MPYKKAVVSNITRNTTAAQGATFNFPLFAASHKYFKEVVRAYSSFDSVKTDASIPTDSNTYKALRIAFSQSPAPEIVYTAKRKADNITITPDALVVGKAYGFSIQVYNTTTGVDVGSVVVATATADSTPTATEIVTKWKTDLSALTQLTVSGTAAVIITATSGFDFVISSINNCTDVYTTTQSAADTLAAIQVENNDWYFMCAEDHTEVFQLAMAAEIEATATSDYPKMYFTTTQDVNTLKALPDPADDVIGKLAALGYDRTVCDWHDQANTIFPEMGLVGANGVYQAGSITWKFTQIKGVPAAADPVTGIRLSDPKQGFIKDRNGGWMGVEKKIPFYHEGKTVGGEWIDIIRGSDWLRDQHEIELLNLLLNQRGGKISYASPNKILNTVDAVNQRAVDIGFLDGYTPATVPDYLTLSFADKASRVLKDVNWTGFIAGAVHNIVTNGNLTYQSEEL
jgi:hypothetical protein